MARGEDVGALIAKKNYSKAIEVIRAQLQTQKNDPRLRLQLGDVLVSAGKNKEAVAILLPLADEFAKEGFAAKAISVLKKIQRLEPTRRDIDQKLASLIQEKQRHATVAVTPSAGPGLEIGMEEIGFEPPPSSPSPSRSSPPAPVPAIEMEAEELSIAPPARSAPAPPPRVGPAARPPAPVPRMEPPRPSPAPPPPVAAPPAPEIALEQGPEDTTGGLVLESEPLELGLAEASPPVTRSPAPPRPVAAPAPPAPVAAPPAPPAPRTAPPVRSAPPLPPPAPEITLEVEPEAELQLEPEPLTEPLAEPVLELDPSELEPAPEDEFVLDEPIPAAEPLPVVDQDLFTGEFEEVEPEAASQPALVDPMTDSGFAEELLSVIDDAFQALPMTPEGGVSFGSDAPSSAEGAQIVVSPLFKDFSVDELVAVIQGLKLLSFGRGQIILREGDAGSSLYMLTDGTVKAFVKRGGKQVPIGELEEGAFFGEMSILTGKPRAATIVAKTACELLELDRATLDEITQSHPHVWDVLQEFASARMVQNR